MSLRNFCRNFRLMVLKEGKRLEQEMKNFKGTCEDIIASDDEVFSVSERIMEQNKETYVELCFNDRV